MHAHSGALQTMTISQCFIVIFGLTIPQTFEKCYIQLCSSRFGIDLWIVFQQIVTVLYRFICKDSCVPYQYINKTHGNRCTTLLRHSIFKWNVYAFPNFKRTLHAEKGTQVNRPIDSHQNRKHCVREGAKFEGKKHRQHNHTHTSTVHVCTWFRNVVGKWWEKLRRRRQVHRNRKGAESQWQN